LAPIALVCAGTADAAVEGRFSQVGNSVVAITSGSLDFTGINILRDDLNFPGALVLSQPNNFSFVSYAGLTNNVGAANSYRFLGITGPVFGGTDGSNSVKFASSSSGSPILFNYVFSNGTGSMGVRIPKSYVFGSQLFATTTWANRTFSDLGLTSGTRLYTLGNTETVTFNVAAIAEPGTWAMMFFGFGCIGAAMRYAKRREKRIANLS
jgi:hypothetical protein